MLAMSVPEFTVVVPCYRCSATIATLIERLSRTFDKLKRTVEFVLVDDYSPDNTADVIKDLRKKDKRIQLIRHFRNYGQHAAILTGIRYAKGDWIVTIDDDLQNPPEELGKMIAVSDNADVVVGYPEIKKHGVLRNLASRIIVKTVAYVFRQGKDFRTSPFRLIKADVAKRMTEIRTGYPFLAALILMVTTNILYVPVRHDERREGRSTYNFTKMISLSSNILFNYSKIPLQAMIGIGMLISFLSLFGLTGIAITKLFIFDFSAGWASLITTIMFFGGLNLIALAILGEYVIRLLDQVSGRRDVIIRETLINETE
jgi:glycosyltransferase involved in cell wall biosynthesis